MPFQYQLEWRMQILGDTFRAPVMFLHWFLSCFQSTRWTGTIWQLHIQELPGLESRPACFQSAWIPGNELYSAGGTLLSPSWLSMTNAQAVKPLYHVEGPLDIQGGEQTVQITQQALKSSENFTPSWLKTINKLSDVSGLFSEWTRSID